MSATASSSNSAPIVEDTARFYTVGLNVFTAAKAFFDGETPPLYTPELRAPAPKLQDSPDPRNDGGDFLDQTEYFQDVVLPFSMVDLSEAIDQTVITVPAARTKVKAGLVEIPPEIILWVTHTASHMDAVFSRYEDFPIPRGFDREKLDVKKHFDLQSTSECETVMINYKQLALLTVGLLFQSKFPKVPAPPVLFVDAAWAHNRRLQNKKSRKFDARFEIKGRRFINIPYELSCHIFTGLLEHYVTVARVTDDCYI